MGQIKVDEHLHIAMEGHVVEGLMVWKSLVDGYLGVEG